MYVLLIVTGNDQKKKRNGSKMKKNITKKKNVKHIHRHTRIQTAAKEKRKKTLIQIKRCFLKQRIVRLLCSRHLFCISIE